MEDQETLSDNDSHQMGTCGGEAFLEWKVFQFGCCFHAILFCDDILVEHHGQLGFFHSLLRRVSQNFPQQLFRDCNPEHDFHETLSFKWTCGTYG